MMKGEEEALKRIKGTTVWRREYQLPNLKKMDEPLERWAWRAVYASIILFMIFTFLDTYLGIKNA